MVLDDRSHLCVSLVFQPTIKLRAVLSPSAIEESDSHSGDKERPLTCHLTENGASPELRFQVFLYRDIFLPCLVIEEAKTRGNKRFSRKESQDIVGQLSSVSVIPFHRAISVSSAPGMLLAVPSA